MTPPRAPASLLPALSIAEPECPAQILAVPLQRTKLVYQLGSLTNISFRNIAARLTQFERGSTVALSDYQGTSIAWTVETFGGNDATLNVPHIRDPHVCGIHFTQSCIHPKSDAKTMRVGNDSVTHPERPGCSSPAYTSQLVLS